MAIERSDILHAIGVFRDLGNATPTPVNTHGFNSFVRNGVGDYTAQCTERIGYNESTADARAGANELVISGAQITTQGVVRVKCFDTLGNPADPVQLTVTVQQVQAGPAGVSALPANPTPVSGGGAMQVLFQQSASPLAVPGDSAEHVIIPSTALVLGATASPVALDFSAIFFCNVLAVEPSNIALRAYLDGVQFASGIGSMMVGGAGIFRAAQISGGGAGAVPPGAHTLELRIISDIDIGFQTGVGVFAGDAIALMRAIWTE